MRSLKQSGVLLTAVELLLRKWRGGVQRVLGVFVPSGEKSGEGILNATFHSISVPNSLQGDIPNYADDPVYNLGSKTTSDVGNTASSLLFSPDSKLSDISGQIAQSQNKRVHIFDYVTVRSEDVRNEMFSRGDQGLVNISELLPKIGPEGQPLYFIDQLPVTTPISVHRHGLRVKSESTYFVQPALLGAGNDFWNRKSQILKWNVLLDMWDQHNHEYLSGSISMRGLPGIRVGYRIDRPELNLSFYVERVSHTWTYPGHMSTQISVTRGQPTAGNAALDYYPPEPNTDSNNQKKQELGRIFEVGKDVDGQPYPPPGTYTHDRVEPKSRSNKKSGIEQILPSGVIKKSR